MFFLSKTNPALKSTKVIFSLAFNANTSEEKGFIVSELILIWSDKTKFLKLKDFVPKPISIAGLKYQSLANFTW